MFVTDCDCLRRIGRMAAATLVMLGTVLLVAASPSSSGLLPGAVVWALLAAHTCTTTRSVLVCPFPTFAFLLIRQQYGRPDNSSRPGGPMTQITFVSASPSSSSNSTFFVLADNTTTASLLTSIWDNCTSVFSTSLSTPNNSVPLPYNDTVPGSPQPEQAVQYYRASSVVLTLNGYNDTAALADNVTGPVGDVPLPGNTDQNLLNCLNYTIGAAVPLIDSDSGASVRWQGSAGMGSMGLLWIVLYLVGSMI
jgi:hypothetical protein